MEACEDIWRDQCYPFSTNQLSQHVVGTVIVTLVVVVLLLFSNIYIEE
jgi:hypothetical protein